MYVRNNVADGDRAAAPPRYYITPVTIAAVIFALAWIYPAALAREVVIDERD